jgi:hypothetical protein
MAGPCHRVMSTLIEDTPSHRRSTLSTHTLPQSFPHNTAMSQNSDTPAHTRRPMLMILTTTRLTMLHRSVRAEATCETRSKLRPSSSTGHKATLRLLHRMTRCTRADGRVKCSPPSRTKILICLRLLQRTGRTPQQYRRSPHMARPIHTRLTHRHHSTSHVIRSRRPSPAMTYSASHMRLLTTSTVSLPRDATPILDLPSLTADQSRAIPWPLRH